MSSSHVTLAAAADERKARLSKYRSLKRKQRDDDDAPPESDLQTEEHPGAEESTQLPLHLSGRNYDSETRGPKLGFETAPVKEEDATLEKQAQQIVAEVRQTAEDEAKDDKGIDLFKLQPKKPNWDLKRELNKKLEILTVRTDNAITKLIRERMDSKKAAALRGGASGALGDGAEVGLDGATLVEGIRVREREDQDEERRARELDEME